MSSRPFFFGGLTDNTSYSLNEHHGTADDLRELAKALHDRNMYLMVDVVANHMVRLEMVSSGDITHHYHRHTVVTVAMWTTASSIPSTTRSTSTTLVRSTTTMTRATSKAAGWQRRLSLCRT